jgi:2-polyprenyl-3-methyl-5-hydroxy-6-metoxy-1,4-benzoquinol methylase
MPQSDLSHRSPSSRTEPCDLCRGTEFQVLATQDRKGTPLVTVVCRTCGLVAHEVIPSDEELDRYYEVDYRREYHNEFTPASHRVMRAWEGGKWLHRLLAPLIPPDAHVCEIGAGIGCTVKVLERAGWNAVGIEPGLGFQQFAQEKLNARVTRQSLFELTSEPQFDFLLLVHVIEHFRSPRQALTHMRSLLRPEGRIYVECPNLAAPHAAPGKQFHFAHIHNFTPRTLTWLAASCGLQVYACLADSREGVLRFVFSRVEETATLDFQDGYAETMELLTRQSRLTYYTRPEYLWGRVARDVRFFSNRFLAKQRVTRLIEQCRLETNQEVGTTAPRRAA